MVEDKILTIEQAAEMLQVNYETARRWVKRGAIPGRKIGKTWRIVESDLRSFIINGPKDGTITA